MVIYIFTVTDDYHTVFNNRLHLDLMRGHHGVHPALVLRKGPQKVQEARYICTYM